MFFHRWKKRMQAETKTTVGTAGVPIIAFTSGKGGSGKTTLAVNFANIIQKKGKTILLIDLDLSNRGSTGLFSTWTRTPFEHLSALRLLRDDLSFNGSCREIFKVKPNLLFVPAASPEEMPWIEPEHPSLEAFVEMVRTRILDLAQRCQISCVVLDCFCGIDLLTTAAASVADDTILVNEPDIITFTGTTNLLFHLRRAFEKLKRRPRLHVVINRVRYNQSVPRLAALYKENLERVIGEVVLCYFPYHPRIFENFGRQAFISDLLPRSLFVKKLQLLAYLLFKDRNDELIPEKARRWSVRKVRSIYVRTIDPSAVNAEYLVVKFTRVPLLVGAWFLLYILLLRTSPLYPRQAWFLALLVSSLFWVICLPPLLQGTWLAARLNYSLAALRFRLARIQERGPERLMELWRMFLACVSGVLTTIALGVVAGWGIYSFVTTLNYELNLDWLSDRPKVSLNERQNRSVILRERVRTTNLRGMTVENLDLSTSDFVKTRKPGEVIGAQSHILVGNTTFRHCHFTGKVFNKLDEEDGPSQTDDKWRGCVFDECDFGETDKHLYISNITLQDVTLKKFPTAKYKAQRAAVFKDSRFKNVKIEVAQGGRLAFLNCEFDQNSTVTNTSPDPCVVHIDPADQQPPLSPNASFKIQGKDEFFWPEFKERLDKLIADQEKKIERNTGNIDKRDAMIDVSELYILSNDPANLKKARADLDSILNETGESELDPAFGRALMLRVLLAIAAENHKNEAPELSALHYQEADDRWTAWMKNNRRVSQWDWNIWEELLPRWIFTDDQLRRIQDVERRAKGEAKPSKVNVQAVAPSLNTRAETKP
jgi:MinD-like ATPase involved in chromosome partitioning or flagellar assembly